MPNYVVRGRLVKEVGKLMMMMIDWYDDAQVCTWIRLVQMVVVYVRTQPALPLFQSRN
jgi:hypothetical protein